MEENEFSPEDLDKVIGGISYEAAVEYALKNSELSSKEQIEQLKQSKAELEEKQQQGRRR